MSTSRVSGPQNGLYKWQPPPPSSSGGSLSFIWQEHLGRKATHLPSAAAPSLTMASDSGMDPLGLKKPCLIPQTFNVWLPGPQVRGFRRARPTCTPKRLPVQGE